MKLQNNTLRRFIYRIRLLINVLRGRYNPVFIIDLEEQKSVVDNQLLAGENVFITGAGQNIGESIAIEMARQGANIYYLDINAQKCLDLEKKLSQYSITFKGFVADVNDNQSINEIVDWFTEENINITTLVNNVGISLKDHSILDYRCEVWQKIFETNVFSPLYLTSKLITKMVNHKTRGKIIFLSSIHQDIIHHNPSYSASKAALAMVIKELSVDLAKYGIRVNGIAPALVKLNPDGSPQYWSHGLLEQISIPPCYIGRAVVYLASDYFSRFTTGCVLKIDNGVSNIAFR